MPNTTINGIKTAVIMVVSILKIKLSFFIFFSICMDSSSPAKAFGRTGCRLYYPLTAPIITPFVKCFCRNGYTHIMGTVAITIAEYLIDSA